MRPPSVQRRGARDRLQPRVLTGRHRVGGRRRVASEADQPAPSFGSPRGERRLLLPYHADPTGGVGAVDRVDRSLIVRTLELRDYRSYPRLELPLEPGIVLAVGPNGAGKTNLLESLHLAAQGFSPRTRSDAQLIRFGENGARVAVEGDHGGSPVSVEVILRLGEAKRARLNGAPLRAAEELRTRLPTLVFTPDRLAIVKGGPAVRRAYFDRSLARLLPARAAASTDYAAALVQRNGGRRRVAGGYSSREVLEPWTRQVAELGAELVTTRR